MPENLDFKSIDKAFEFLHKKGFSINESRSIFLKFFLLRKHSLVNATELKKQQVCVREFLDSKCDISSRYLSKIEKFQVSDKYIPTDLIKDLFKIFDNLTDNQFFLLLDTEKARKNKGQYFTPPEIVSKIYLSLFPERNNKEDCYTVVDFSAGLGEFVKPLIHHSNFISYAVELDPISYEFLLFNIIWNQNYEYSLKSKALLGILQGDSLLGYQETLAEQLIASSKGKDLLRELIQIRKRILFTRTDDFLEDIDLYLRCRERITQFQESLSEFNWFVDFPEIFFDEKLESLKLHGFDYVVGNPPWIGFQSINHDKYRSLFSNEFFSKELYGKYNFSLPFMILSHELSKVGGGFVIPRGILSETYAQVWREKIIQDESLSNIILLQKKWFDNILNEFCIVFWDKKKTKDLIEISDEENEEIFILKHNNIKSPLYRIPIISNEILEQIEHIYDLSVELQKVCEIRRGLTLSKKYQEKYFQKKDKLTKKDSVKKLIRHNKNNTKQKEGISNFQVFHSGEEFVYDKRLLGAPGSSELFEQPKIIRRNRGKYWLIGLDIEGDFYVNDIFDIIFPKPNRHDVKVTFGYLCSSIFQFLAENYLQRDITSNFVRKLPYPKFSEGNILEIKGIVDQWLVSQKRKEDMTLMRKEIDTIVNNHYQLSKEIQQLLESKVKLHWVD